MESRRKISTLIPYKIRENKVLVYLQKRSKDAKRLPDFFGFFGGGIERGENPEEALRREMKEEINFVPEGFQHFKKYEFDRSIKDIFILEVLDGFEDKVAVLEGEYAKWFNEQEALDEPKLIDEDKLVLKELCSFLRTKK